MKSLCVQGNVGDSRAVASLGGRVVPLSHDHKPTNEAESKRIVAAGGWVEYNRVNGNLALSRALGDFVFKKNTARRPEEQIVSAEPDILRVDLTDDLEFVVMACDGIWDVLSNQVRASFATFRSSDFHIWKLLSTRQKRFVFFSKSVDFRESFFSAQQHTLSDVLTWVFNFNLLLFVSINCFISNLEVVTKRGPN